MSHTHSTSGVQDTDPAHIATNGKHCSTCVCKHCTQRSKIRTMAKIAQVAKPDMLSQYITSPDQTSGNQTRPRQGESSGHCWLDTRLTICHIGEFNGDGIISLLEVKLIASAFSFAQPMAGSADYRLAFDASPLPLGSLGGELCATT